MYSIVTRWFCNIITCVAILLVEMVGSTIRTPFVLVVEPILSKGMLQLSSLVSSRELKKINQVDSTTWQYTELRKE